MIYLWAKGYKIMNWRYRNHLGEIDIIAKKGDYLIFIEVKARKNSKIASEILTQNQIRRIKNSAEYFMARNHNLRHLKRRFDFILVQSFFRLSHQKNYFAN